MSARLCIQVLVALGFIVLGVLWIASPGHVGPGLGMTIVGLGFGATAVYKDRQKKQPAP